MIIGKACLIKHYNTFWHHYRRNYFWTNLPDLMLWLVVYVAIGGTIIVIKLQYPGKFMSISSSSCNFCIWYIYDSTKDYHNLENLE